MKAARRRPRTAPASERALDEWLRRVEAEYRSAAFTQHLTLWLIQLGASPDLIDDGLRIVKDELVHADLSHRTYLAGGGHGAPRIVRDSLALRRSRDPLEHDVLRTAVEVFCLGETVAVRLFKELRAGCRIAPARRALDRVLRDEVRHRDFGWQLLDWLLEQPYGAELRALARKELPVMFRRLRALYAPTSAKETEISASDREWGLMPNARYGVILNEVLERDYVPRFSARGVDARAAWPEGKT